MNTIIGGILGVLSGFGIGGGTLFIIYLTFFLGLEQITAQGLNLAYFIASGTPAVALHLKNKLIEKKVVAKCLITGIPACILTGILANSIDVSILRRIFGGLLIYIGIKLVFSKSK